MPLRILVVEDDPKQAERLREHLERYAQEQGQDFEIVHLSSALEFAERRPEADAIFMDIGLPGMSGMQAAQVLRGYDSETPLVFVTDLAQFAVDGYAVDALDFIVKPVEYRAFAPRMDRIMRIIGRKHHETLAIPTPDGTAVVGICDILYIETYRHDLHYHLADGRVLRRRGSLTELEEQLAPKGFVRISASCLANMAQLAQIRSNTLVLRGGEELSIGRSRRKQALETISAYLAGSI